MTRALTKDRMGIFRLGLSTFLANWSLRLGSKNSLHTWARVPNVELGGRLVVRHPYQMGASQIFPNVFLRPSTRVFPLLAVLKCLGYSSKHTRYIRCRVVVRDPGCSTRPHPPRRQPRFWARLSVDWGPRIRSKVFQPSISVPHSTRTPFGSPAPPMPPLHLLLIAANHRDRPWPARPPKRPIDGVAFGEPHRR